MSIKTFSQKNLVIGTLSGLFAGIALVFPLLYFDSIKVIGGLVGLSHIFSSLSFYLFLTAILGTIFATAICKLHQKLILLRSVLWGVLYGVFLWLINLLMLVAKMKTDNFSHTYPSVCFFTLLLLGYMLFGLILGFIHQCLRKYE